MRLEISRVGSAATREISRPRLHHGRRRSRAAGARLWFGLIHTPQLFGDWVGVAVVTVMGAVFTFMRQRYDSIFPSMISHFTYNATLALAAIVGSTLE